MRTLVVTLCLALVVTSCSSQSEAPPSSPSETTPTPGQTTGSPAEPRDDGLTLLIPTTDGIRLDFPDGPDRLLTVDTQGDISRLFSGIRTALSDLSGGVVFQHELTPPPWIDGAILHLPTGANAPTVLVEPPLDSGEDELFGSEWSTTTISLLDVVNTALGPAVVYGSTESLKWGMGSETVYVDVLPVSGGPSIRIAEGWSGPGNRTDITLSGASCGGELCVASMTSEYGTSWLEFTGLDGEPVDVPGNPFPCEPSDVGGFPCADRGDDGIRPEQPQLSDDGERLVYRDGRKLVVADLRTGTIERRIGVARFDSWLDRVFYDGDSTMVLVHEAFYEVVDLDGEVPTSLRSYRGARAGVASSVDIATGASLGSASDDIPCSAAGRAAAEAQEGLPAPVAATRRQIGRLAAACDFAGLAAFHDPEPASAERLAQKWIEDERRGIPVLAAYVQLLDLPWAVEPGTTDTYVWPSVVRPTLDDWETLGEWTESLPDGHPLTWAPTNGYSGMRVQIDADGTWRDDPYRKPWESESPPLTLPPEAPPPTGYLIAVPLDGFQMVSARGTVQSVTDPYWPSEIKVARDDGSGGVVFQYLVTPPTRTEGTIFHLPAGATRPRVVVTPPASGENTALLEVVDFDGVMSALYATSPAATTVGWYEGTGEAIGSNPRSLWMVPLAGGNPRLIGVWGTADDDTTMWAATYADSRFVVTIGPKSGGDWWCRYFEVVDVGTSAIEDARVDRRSHDSCRNGSTVFDDVFYSYAGVRTGLAPTLSADGSILVYERQTWLDPADTGWGDAVVVSLLSGRRTVIEADRVWAYDRHRTLLITRGGRTMLATLDYDDITASAFSRSAAEAVTGNAVLGLMSSPPSLASSAGLASGVEALPCSTEPFEYLPLPDLPANAESSRQEILLATVSCDFDGLAALARRDPGFTFSLYWAGFEEYEEGWITPTRRVSDADPLAHWVRDDVTVGFLHALNRALNTAPTRMDTARGEVWLWRYEPLELDVLIAASGDWLTAGNNTASGWTD